MHKYGNHPVKYNGIYFVSKAEARRYGELMLLMKAGRIKDLELQPKFELQPKYKKNGKTVRAITYIADFKYQLVSSGRYVVEDVKGMQTQAFKIKKKMFEYKYPDLELILVK